MPSLRMPVEVVDRFSGPLRRARTQAEAVQRAVDDIGDTSETAGAAADRVIGQTTRGVQNQTRAFDALRRAAERYRRAHQQGNGPTAPVPGNMPVPDETGLPGNLPTTNPFAPMATSALSIAAAGVAAKKAWSFTWEQATQAALQKTQKTTMQALLQHKEAGSALYDYVSEYAKVSALGREDLANATASYVTFTKRADLLERMLKMTERLYAKDPTQGAQGAAFAMKELLAGDTMSVKERYNMVGISGAKIREFSQSGDVEGMLDYIDVMFNKFGATQEVVDANFNNLTTQANIFTSNLSTAMAESANPAMETLAAVMQRLNADMDAGRFQPFFALVTSGTQMIAQGAAWVADNLNVILPIVAGLTTAFIVYKGAQMAATVTTAVLSAATNLMTGNFLGAAAAVAGLIGGLAAFSALNKNIDLKTNADLSGLEEAKKKYANFEDKIPVSASAPMPTEISNKAPIKVKGEVEIEEESLRHMIDINGQQWLAKFTTATLAPQNVFYGTTIRESMDFDRFTQITTDSLKEAIETTGEG